MQDNRQEELLNEFRGFTNREIGPFAARFEAEEAIPEALIRKLGEGSWLGAPFPKEYGGLGFSAEAYGRLTEIVSHACSATRTLFTVSTSLVGETLLRWGSASQKKRYIPELADGSKIGAFALSEPEAGSDAAGIGTAYRQQGARYRINGHKKWISLGGIADFFILLAVSPEKGMTAFLIDSRTPGINISPIRGMLAGRATFLSDIELIDVEAGPEDILGREGGGFAYIVNTALDHGRFSIAWAALGIAQRALDEMVDYSGRRRQFGEKISRYQLIQEMIAEGLTGVHAARALCEATSRLRQARDPYALQETCLAKYFTTRLATRITADALQLHGANGCSDRYPVERLFREARVLEIIEGSSQIMQQLLAGYGMKKYAKNHR